MALSVREMTPEDIPSIVDYFIRADAAFLHGMGADKEKLPKRNDWINKLQLEHELPISEKTFYYLIWVSDGVPIGHSNINEIEFGYSAKIHLHMWRSDKRRSGLGPEFLKKSIPHYFSNFKLQKLICEPYAENIAPNKVLASLGFKFIKTYETTPGWICFLQKVNRYELSYSAYQKQKELFLY